MLLLHSNGIRLTREQYDEAGKELGCNGKLLLAIAYQESNNGGFRYMDRVSMLFEPTKFNFHSRYAFAWSHPELTGPQLGYGSYHHQWQMLEAAYWLDPDAALKAASWGLFHLLGEDYSLAGYGSVRYFVQELIQSEKKQLNALVRFVQTKPLLVKAMAQLDWANVARYYNGPGYKRNNYNVGLKDHYDTLK